MAHRRALSILAVIAAISACSSSSGESEPDAVIRPNVRVLDAASLARIQSITTEGTITFDGHDSAIDALASGHVVAGAISSATPHGLLRRVTAVAPTAKGVIVQTEPAALTDAIAKGRIHASKTLTAGDLRPASDGTPAPGFYVALNEEVLYDGGSYGARVTASGSISFEPSIDVDLDIGWEGISSLSATLGGTEGATLDLTAGAGISVDERKDIASYDFVPWVVYVYDFPVVFAPRLVLQVGVSGHVDAQTTASFVQQAHAKVGLGYASGSIYPIAEVDPSFSFGPPNVTASAQVKGWAGARGEVMIEGVLGPYGTLDGYLRLSADPNAKPCWSLDVGVESDFGLMIDIFGLKILDTSRRVLDVSKPIASGDCGAPGTQVPSPWAYVYKRAGGDAANAVSAMPDGGVVVAGDASADAAVTRIGPDGAILWQRAYPMGTVARAVRGGADYVFVGGDAWLAKLDAKTGDVLWSNRYGSDPEIKSIDATVDGGCVVAGLTVGPGSQFDYWWAKIGAGGALAWSKRMGDATWEEVHAVRALASGGYVMVGQYAANQSADAFFAVTDDSGNVTVQKRYANAGTYESFDAVLPVAGGYVVVGRAQRPAGGAGWAVKLDASGAIVWSKAFGETNADYMYDVAPNATGFLATGSTGILPTKAWAVALDVSGHPLWSRAYAATDATKNVDARGLAMFADGSFTFGGATNAFGDSNLVAMHPSFDGALDFAQGSGVIVTTLGGTSEAPYAPAVTTTTYQPVAYAAAPVAVAVTPAALNAAAQKLSK